MHKLHENTTLSYRRDLNIYGFFCVTGQEYLEAIFHTLKD